MSLKPSGQQLTVTGVPQVRCHLLSGHTSVDKGATKCARLCKQTSGLGVLPLMILNFLVYVVFCCDAVYQKVTLLSAILVHRRVQGSGLPCCLHVKLDPCCRQAKHPTCKPNAAESVSRKEVRVLDNQARIALLLSLSLASAKLLSYERYRGLSNDTLCAEFATLQNSRAKLRANYQQRQST